MKQNFKKVAIVGPPTYPIPYIRGGAIERLMTILVDQNEINHKLDITVFTVYDKDLNEAVRKYKFSRFIQIKSGIFVKFLLLVYRILRVLLLRRIPIKSEYMVLVNWYLKKGNYDVIYMATSNQQVAELTTKTHAKILYAEYSDYLRKDSYGIESICNKVTAFVGNTYLVSRIIEELGVQKSQTRILNAGYDLTEYSESFRNESRDLIRNKHNIKEDEVVILYCGRLSPEKGPLELIKAVQSVPNCRLILIGGSNFSKNERNDYVLKLYEEAEKCNGRVIFTGYIPDEKDVIPYRYGADIGVVPSICNEAASGAMFEFRTASLPTIISKMGGMPYFAGENVIMVDYDDNFVNSLAETIALLVNNESLRKKLAAAARNGIEKCSRESYFDSFSSIVCNL